jgi:hypothetical protein
MHARIAGPGRMCKLLLASLSVADNQNMQDAGYCALSIDLSDLHDIAILCETENASIIRMHFLTA